MAGALTAAVADVICAAVVALWPAGAERLAGSLMHLVNLQAAEITWGVFLSGLVQAFVYGYAAFWVFAWIYNRSLRGSRA